MPPPPEENPRPTVARTTAWPVPVTDQAAIAAHTTALVRQTREMIASGGDETGQVWGLDVASAAEQEGIAAWDRDAAFLAE